MSEKRLSERMSDTSHAVGEAQDALQSAITKAINTHFDAGIEFEREHIVKLLNDSSVRAKWIEATSNALPTYQGVVDFFTALIKGEQK